MRGKTYDKQCVKSPVFGVQVVFNGLAGLTDRSVPSAKCIKCVKASVSCVQVVLGGLAVLTDTVLLLFEWCFSLTIVTAHLFMFHRILQY